MPEVNQSSGEQSTTTIIYAGPCVLLGVHLISNETNDVKVILHDNASAASGTVKGECNLDTSVEGFGKYVPFASIEMVNGIYATGSGTGATYIVEYRPIG